MNKDIWSGWYWSKLVNDMGRKQEAIFAGKPSNANGTGGGCLMVLICWPVLLECLLVGTMGFQLVSQPPTGTFRASVWPFLPRWGLPNFLGLWAGFFFAVLYLAIHGFWPVGVLLTAVWTPFWMLFGHQLDVPGFNGGAAITSLLSGELGALWNQVKGHDWSWGVLVGLASLVVHGVLIFAFRNTGPKTSALKTTFKELYGAAFMSLVLTLLAWFGYMLKRLLCAGARHG